MSCMIKPFFTELPRRLFLWITAGALAPVETPALYSLNIMAGCHLLRCTPIHIVMVWLPQPNSIIGAIAIPATMPPIITACMALHSNAWSIINSLPHTPKLVSPISPHGLIDIAALVWSKLTSHKRSCFQVACPPHGRMRKVVYATI